MCPLTLKIGVIIQNKYQKPHKQMGKQAVWPEECMLSFLSEDWCFLIISNLHLQYYSIILCGHKIVAIIFHTNNNKIKWYN